MKKYTKDMSLELTAFLCGRWLCNTTESEEMDLLKQYFHTDIHPVGIHKYETNDYAIKLCYHELLWSSDKWFDKAVVEYKI